MTFENFHTRLGWATLHTAWCRRIGQNPGYIYEQREKTGIHPDHIYRTFPWLAQNKALFSPTHPYSLFPDSPRREDPHEPVHTRATGSPQRYCLIFIGHFPLGQKSPIISGSLAPKGAFRRNMTCNFRHPMSLRHTVAHPLKSTLWQHLQPFNYAAVAAQSYWQRRPVARSGCESLGWSCF